jgi:hypothetical protein
MVAFALRNDGWWLRGDIIWAKKNPLPESVRDRPTRSHEFIFLLSKSARYYYDAEAVKEPVANLTVQREQDPQGRQRGERSRTNTHLGSSIPIEIPLACGIGGRMEHFRQGFCHFAVFPRPGEPASLQNLRARVCQHAENHERELARPEKNMDWQMPASQDQRPRRPARP